MAALAVTPTERLKTRARMHRVLFLTILVVGLAIAVPLQDAQAQDNAVGKDDESLLDKLNSRCSKREASACLMLKLVSYVNRLLKKADIPLSDGLEITQSREVIEESLVDPAARGLETEEEQVGDLVARKIWAFVKSRSLRWEVLPGSEVILSTTPNAQGEFSLDLSLKETAGDEGRGKKNNMGPLLAAGAMKIGMVGILAFKALALLVGKALLVSKLAFLLAAIIGLKKLFSQQKHVTYEVVAHPHHSHSHVASEHGHGGGDSYSSGWGRSIEAAPASGDPQTLAYSAHAPKSGLQ